MKRTATQFRDNRFPRPQATKLPGLAPVRPRPIRQQLEFDAWRRHPEFAQKLADRRAGVLRKDPHPVAPGSTRETKRFRIRAILTLVVALLLLSVARIGVSQTHIVPEPQSAAALSESWGLVFQAPGTISRAVALDTDITAEITGLVARVEVRQRFRNTSQAWAEATYRYPLPLGATVDRLLVDAGGRILEGEIRERKTAERQYQQARAEGMVAALVTQEAANQFETRLANIGPDEEIIITIGFLAPVDYRDETFSLQIPLTFTPRWYPPAERLQDQPVSAPVAEPIIQPLDSLDDHRLTLNIDLYSGFDIESLGSRYHDIEIHPRLGGYHLFLADPDTRTDRIFELQWKPAFGTAPSSSLLTWDGGDAVYAMLMVSPPLAKAIEPRPREVVFVIDTSGSMEGISMRQARAALYQGLDRLDPEDYFNLIEFNSESSVLFESSAPVDEAALMTAMDFIDGLVASGGTNMAPALRDAMKLPAQTGLLRQIVFITDGSVGNEDELLKQIADELGDSRLFTVSIGPAPNTAFMRKAAAFGRGQHTHIGDLREVEERMSALWSRIARPALQDIRIDFGSRAEYFPEIIPDLYAGEPLWVYARLPHEPREVTLTGELDGEAWEQTIRPLAGSGGENLGLLWARSKIEALQDSRLSGADAELTQLEVTALALEFSMITPYTSLVAVDRTPVRPAGKNLQTDAIPSLLPAGSSATSLGFSPTATGWLGQFLMALATLVFATCLLWFCSPPRRVQAGGVSAPPLPAGKAPTPAGSRSLPSAGCVPGVRSRAA